MRCLPLSRPGLAVLAMALSGCLGGPSAPVSGPSDAISVIALPDPGPQVDAVAQGAAEEEVASAVSDGVAALPDPGLPDTARRAPRHRPDGKGTDTAGTTPTPRPAPMRSGPPPLPVPSTVFGQQMQEQAQEQCTAAGGRLARRGSSDALSCFIQPKDAGKRCTRKSDCQGQCLARSGTCSPVIPLLGCHEVLLDSGQRVTECRR